MESLCQTMGHKTGDARTAHTRSTATNGSRGEDHDNRSDNCGTGLSDRHQWQLRKEDIEYTTAAGEPLDGGSHRVHEESPSGEREDAQAIHPERQIKPPGR